MNKFQDRLLDLLTEKGLSRLKLAKILNISSTTINGYFNKEYYPQIDIALKLANYFDCSLDYLFGRDDNIKNFNKSDNFFIEIFDGLLKERKISIAKALRDMKMSEYNYYRWKSGLFPKTINLIEIADYFDISIDYLIGRQ